MESMEEQLLALYDERERMAEQLGVVDADGAIEMVRSLESQLRSFYETYGHLQGADNAELAQVLAQIKELSETLDTMYTTKSVTLEMSDERPVLRAVWTDTNTEGDQR